MQRSVKRKKSIWTYCPIFATGGLILSLITSCAAVPTFRAAGEENLQESEVAVLENRWGCPFCVLRIWEEDGKTKVYSLYSSPRERFEAFYLVPGTYVIEYEYRAYKTPIFRGQDTVKLEAGRRYRVESKTRMWFGPNSTRIWIEDKATGEVVGGQPW